jgi:predicted Rossmann-fold nucleotide-binding protein
MNFSENCNRCRPNIKAKPMIEKIISGGQTGADRAALDVAIKLGIPYGGWIPKGRITEEGSLPEKY